jgi:hypothetical protein
MFTSNVVVLSMLDPSQYSDNKHPKDDVQEVGSKNPNLLGWNLLSCFPPWAHCRFLKGIFICL